MNDLMNSELTGPLDGLVQATSMLQPPDRSPIATSDCWT